MGCLESHYEGGTECCCSTHALAETYTTLTSIPLQNRIFPLEAAQIIEVSLMTKFTILEISQGTYHKAIRNVADLGFRSGMIYDALHLACAEAEGCERIDTFNLKNFQRLEPKGIVVLSP
jgi:predicted nucleic acid-binding protein